MLPISFTDIVEHLRSSSNKSSSGVITSIAPVDLYQTYLEKRELRLNGFVAARGQIPSSTYTLNGIPPRVGGRKLTTTTTFTLRSNEGAVYEFKNSAEGYENAWIFLMECADQREEILTPPKASMPKEIKKSKRRQLVDSATSPVRAMQIRQLKKQLAVPYEANKGYSMSPIQTPKRALSTIRTAKLIARPRGLLSGGVSPWGQVMAEASTWRELPVLSPAESLTKETRADSAAVIQPTIRVVPAKPTIRVVAVDPPIWTRDFAYDGQGKGKAIDFEE